MNMQSVNNRISLGRGLCVMGTALVVAMYSAVILRSHMMRTAGTESLAAGSLKAAAIKSALARERMEVKTLAGIFSAVSGADMQPEQRREIMEDILRTALSAAETCKIGTVGLVFAGVAFMLLRYLTGEMTAQLSRVVELAASLAKGNLSRRLNMTGNDEIGALAGALDSSCDSLADLIGKINTNKATQAGAYQELFSVSSQLAATSEEMSSQAESVAGATEEMSASIAGITDIIQRMNESSSVISKSVEEQTGTSLEISDSVQQATAGIANIATSIAELARGANDVSKSAAEAARGVTEIYSNIQGLSRDAAESSAGAQRVNGTSSELARIAAQLRDMAAGFKVTAA